MNSLIKRVIGEATTNASDAFDIDAAIAAMPPRQEYLKQQLAAGTITPKDAVEYTILAAESLLPIWEKERPKDQRPRQATEAAWRWWHEPTEGNRKAAETAAYIAKEAYYLARGTQAGRTTKAAKAARAAAYAASAASGGAAHAVAAAATITEYLADYAATAANDTNVLDQS